MTAENKYTTEEVSNLLQKSFGGDREAATSLLRSYTNDMYYVAKLYMEDTEAAKKAVQKSFVTAYKKLRDVSDAENFEEWLTDITRRTSVRTQVPFKEEKTESSYTDSDEAPEEGVQLPGDISTCKKYVLAALNVLSPSERTAAALRWYDHMSVEEIAELMQADQTSVETWLTNAKECFNEAGMEFGRFTALVNGINPVPEKTIEEAVNEDDGLIPTRSLKLAEIAAAAAAADAAKAEAERKAAEALAAAKAAEEAARIAEEARRSAEEPVFPEEPEAEDVPAFPEEPEEETPAFPEEPVFPEEPEEEETPVFEEEPVFPAEPEDEHTAMLETIDDEELDLSSVPGAPKFADEGETRVVTNLKSVPEDHDIWGDTAETSAEEIFKADEQENSSNITRDVETRKPAAINPRNIYDDDDEDEDDEEELSPKERKKRAKAEAKRKKQEEEYDEYDDDEYDDEEESHPVLMALLIILIVLALAAGGIVFLYTKDRVLFNKLPFSEKIVEVAKKVMGKDTESEVSEDVSSETSVSADSSEEDTEAADVEASDVIGHAVIVIDELHVRSLPSTDGENVGSVYSGEEYDVYEISSDDAYDWYRIADDQWIADTEGSYLEYTPAQ